MSLCMMKMQSSFWRPVVKPCLGRDNASEPFVLCMINRQAGLKDFKQKKARTQASSEIPEYCVAQV